MGARFMVAFAVLVAATTASAEPKSPATKAGQCAGKNGPKAGCTGYEVRLRRSPEPAQASASAEPPKPEVNPNLLEHLRDPAERSNKQSTKLLLAELRGLERLLASTPKNAPERPSILRRLAEGYAELAARKAREGALAEERARHAK